MMLIVITAILIVTALTVYGILKSVNFRKFLCGAFFVSGGIQCYLAFMKIAVPVYGTTLIQTPEMGYLRGVIHLLACALMGYFGFIRPTRKTK